MRKLVIGLLIGLLYANFAFASVRFGDGTKTVTTAGTAVALTSTSTPATTLVICADTGNTGLIVFGETPVATAGAQEGVVLSAGNCVGINTDNTSDSFDISNFKINSTVSAEEASYFYFFEQR